MHSYAEICQLLTVTPESHAGLFYLSLGLFHPQADVRAGVLGLISRLREHTAGRHFWNGLNSFAKLAFLRMQKQLAGGKSQSHQAERQGRGGPAERDSADTVDEARGQAGQAR